MRKSLLFLCCVLLYSFNNLTQAQVIFQDNFDSYVADSIIDPQSNDWTGWDNLPTSAYVSDDTSASGNNSLKIWDATVPGSSAALSDVTYSFGNKTTGRYLVTFKVYVPSDVNGIGAGTYWNMLHVYNNSSAGAEWAFQVYLRPPGQPSNVEIGGSVFPINTKYDEWVKVAHIVDLDRDSIDLYYDGQLIMSQRFSQQPFNTTGTKQLAAIDFFAECGGGSCVEVGYFDDFLYQNFPDQYNDAGLTNLTVPDYCVGNPVNLDATIKNFGFDTINSVTVEWSVDGVAQTPVVYNTAPIYPGSTAFVNLGSYTFTGSSHEVKAWTSNPNMNTDSVNFNDTLETSVSVPMISGPNLVCPSVDFTLSVSGSGIGVSYDWEYLDTNTNSWVPANAFSQVYPIVGGISSAMDYRVITTCTAGGSDTSSVHSITLKPFLDCYCVPAYSSGCTFGDDINSVTLNGVNGTSINDLNTGCSPNSYDDKTNSLPIIDLVAGLTHHGTINSTYSFPSEYAKIWIDFGNDGQFQDSTDLVGTVGPFSNVTVPFTINIPSLADSGLHRMRIRSVFGNSSYTFDACGSYSYGEAHDYMTYVISPSCKVPYDLSADNITPDSADLSWVEPGLSTQWYVEYGTAGFTQGTGFDTIVTSIPLSITGLSPNTEYDFYVSSVCGRNDTSYAAGPFKFLTPCTEISTFPYLENFDGTIINDVWNCWTVYNIDGGNTWIQDDIYLTPHSMPYVAHGMGNNNDMLISPKLSLPTAPMWLKLYDIVENSTYNNIYSVLVSTTGKDTADFTDTLATFNVTNTTWAERTVDLSAYANQDIHIALWQSYSAASFFGFGVDDFLIQEIPSCIKPDDLGIANLTSDSVDLSWTEINTATQWEIQYGTLGFTLGNGSSVIAGSNPFTLNTVNPNTVYEYYVRSICGRGDTSYWAGPFQFETPCLSMTAPYFRDFEADVNGSEPDCWTGIKTVQFSEVYVNSFTGTSAPYAGSKALYLYGYNGVPGIDEVMAVTPAFSDLTSYDKQIRFFANSGDAISGLIIGTMASPIDTNTKSPLDTIYFSQPNVYEEIIFLFDMASGYNGTDQYIYLEHSLSSLYQYVRIDDFHYELIPSCKKPNLLSANNITTNSAILNWNEKNIATAWEIEYGTSGYTFGNGTRDTVSSNPYTLSGLNSYTSYDYYVRSICGRGDSSYWSGPYSFVTAAALPFAEDFETFGSVVIPVDFKGWESVSNTFLDWGTGTLTTSGSTGPDQDHTVGAGGTFAFLETSSGATGDTAVLQSPLIEIDPGVTDMELEFWYHKYGATMEALLFYIEANGVEYFIDSIQGQTHTSGVDPWTLYSTVLNGYQGQVIRLKFKGVRGTSFTGDMAVDDISLRPLADTDGGLVDVVEPIIKTCYTANEPVSVSIVNAGINALDFALNNATITLDITGAMNNTITYQLNDNSLNSGNPLASLDTLIIPIDTVDLSNSGNYYFEYTLSIPGDIITSNDILRDTVESAIGGNVIGPDTICIGDTVGIALENYVGSIQWQVESAGTFTDISGANSSELRISPTVTTQYRAFVCGRAVSDTLTVEPISVSQPIAFDSMIVVSCGDSGIVPLVATSIDPNVSFNWYNVPIGGNALEAGGNIVSISPNGDTLYYKGTPMSANSPAIDTFYVSASFGGGGSDTALPVPHGSVYSGSARGYHFEAPIDFTITGLEVAIEAGSGNQHVAVLKTNNNAAWNLWSAAIVPFTTLFYTTNASPSGYIPVNIPIKAGEKIAILGQRGTSNSYSNASTIEIDGKTVSIQRFIMQANLDNTAPANAAQMGYEAASNISRVNFTYSTGCESSRAQVIGEIDCLVGMNELGKVFANISIQPNPSRGIFNIIGSNVKEEVEISIFNANGKMVFESADKLSNNFEQRIDISDFAKGLYFVKLQSKTSMEMKKIVIQ